MMQSPHIESDHLIVIFLLGSIYLILRKIRKSTRYPLPPSPPMEPIIGHLRIVPSQNPEIYYQRLSKKYGEFFLPRIFDTEDLKKEDSDILYFRQFRTPVIIVNSTTVAEELLSKRGANYSDRPRFVLFEMQVFFDEIERGIFMLMRI